MTPMSRAFWLALLLPICSCSMAPRPCDPDPGFAEDAAHVARYITPETDSLVEGEALTGIPKSWTIVTDKWLRIACSGGKAVALRGPGEGMAEIVAPRDGAYHLWVRSHGAAGREFQVWVNEKPAPAKFGDRSMSWRHGGSFKLARGKVRLRVGAARNNPYLDCVILSSDSGLRPETLGALRAFGGDERWARAGEPVRFSGGLSAGRVTSWRWDFGDGLSGDGQQIAHAYTTAGDYAFTLTVSDRAGRSARRTETAHVWPAIDYTVLCLPVTRYGPPRFGDINGDGAPDCLAGSPFRSADAYLHDGRLLWSYESPPEFSTPVERREHPMVIWDFDGDGKGEVAMWRFMEGKAWLCLCDGMTGKVRKRAPWPVAEGYVNGRLAVGNLTGKPDGATILMLNGEYEGRKHQEADAYDAELNHLWSYARDGGDALGHFIYSRNVEGDAREEVFVSAAMLRPDGSVAWERKDLFSSHADSIRVGDINEDGKGEVVYSYSGLGVYVLDATSGKTLWHFPTNHAQQLEIGDVRPDVPGIEVIVGDRFYLPTLRARLLVFDCKGRLLSAFPKTAITGNPNLGILEWDGNAGMEIAWANMVLDGRCKVLAVLPGHLHHAFDFVGEGREEFVCGFTSAQGKRFIAAFGNTDRTRRLPRKNDYETRRKAANHTHY